MNIIRAYMKAQAKKGNELKVFDWEKAANIIRERKATRARAGFSEDWEWTAVEILRDGKPVSEDMAFGFLASVWATPELEVDGVTIDCYRMQSETPCLDIDTYWPDVALEIIRR